MVIPSNRSGSFPQSQTQTYEWRTFLLEFLYGLLTIVWLFLALAEMSAFKGLTWLEKLALSLSDEPHTQDMMWGTLAILLGLPAIPQWGPHMLGELRRAKKIVSIAGIGCTPAVVQVTRPEMLEWLGRECAAGRLPFPDTNGPITWPSFEPQDALATAA